MPDQPEMRPPLPPIGPMGANASKMLFDVVALKKGVGESDAKPEDFKRYPFSAAHSYEAMEAVRPTAEAEGFEPMVVVAQGHFSDIESMARARASFIEPLDRSKI